MQNPIGLPLMAMLDSVQEPAIESVDGTNETTVDSARHAHADRRRLSLLSDIESAFDTVVSDAESTVSSIASTLEAALVDLSTGFWENIASSSEGLNTPFGGDTPTFSQLAAMSSGTYKLQLLVGRIACTTWNLALMIFFSVRLAATGFLSPLNPSTFVQFFSKYSESAYYTTDELEDVLDAAYVNSDVYNMSVCAQWPNDCGEQDTRFFGWRRSRQPCTGTECRDLSSICRCRHTQDCAYGQQENGGHDGNLFLLFDQLEYKCISRRLCVAMGSSRLRFKWIRRLANGVAADFQLQF